MLKRSKGVLPGSKTFKEKMHKTFEAVFLVGMHKNNKIIEMKKTKDVKETEILL